MIVWITGLSGAGKTTIGRELFAAMKRRVPNVVLLDGDEVRSVFQLQQLARPYSAESRKAITQGYHRLCLWLDRQDIHVVCCTIAGNQEIRDENRRAFGRYFEVLVDVPVAVLAARDDKNLYRRALNGEAQDVVGVDIDYPAPAHPDLVIDNSAHQATPASLAATILDAALDRFPDLFPPHEQLQTSLSS